MEGVLNIFNIILEAILENRTVFFLSIKEEEETTILKRISEKNTLYFFLDKNGVLQKEGYAKNFSDILNVVGNTGFLLVIDSEIKTSFCLKKRQEDWFYDIIKNVDEKEKNALLIKL